MIEFKEVEKRYPNGYEALKHINLTIDQGEFVAIIGLSGAGKSTLIRTINRMHDITQGQLTVDGTDVMSLHGKSLRKFRRKIGMIFQSFNLITRTTVIKNVLTAFVPALPWWRATLGIFTKAEKILAFNNPLMQFCLYSVMIFVLYFGSYTIITSKGLDLDVGQFSALLTYNFQILSSLMMLSMVFVMITMASESARRIVEVLDEKSTLSNPENPVYEVKDGSIDFDGVSFKYSEKADKMALADIDLHIKSGQTIGIIGGTGSSKSSLIQLISRLYDATEGVVKVGGRDVREYDLDTLRNQVAVVLQKNVLFSGTIKDNLRWGNPNATDAEMEEACRLAQADEFIQQFPDKYDTWIEQGGTNVSGGQKQRLCIARAMLRKPAVLILDDSTSAVDSTTEAAIRASFAKNLKDTTIIMIAQRISSVQYADEILILDDDHIAARGTHEELLKTSPIYQEIYQSQQEGVGG